MRSLQFITIASIAALLTFGCSSNGSEERDEPPQTSSSATATPTVSSQLPPSAPAPEPLPPPPPVPVPEPITFQCGDFSLYQSGTALYSDGTTGYEAECDTYVPPPPELRYCDYGGTAVYTDGSYSVNDPACVDTSEPAESGYPYNEAEDRNGDGVVNGYERCGVLCGEEPTSGDIQTQYGCEQGYITGPQCE